MSVTPRTDGQVEDARIIALDFECHQPQPADHCPVVPAAFARTLELELTVSLVRRDAWKACAETLVEYASELAEVQAWKRGCGIRNSRDMAELDAAIAMFEKLKGTQ